MPWRDLPERYGPYTTAYNRFNRWSRRGIWKQIFDTLASKCGDGASAKAVAPHLRQGLDLSRPHGNMSIMVRPMVTNLRCTARDEMLSHRAIPRFDRRRLPIKTLTCPPDRRRSAMGFNRRKMEDRRTTASFTAACRRAARPRSRFLRTPTTWLPCGIIQADADAFLADNRRSQIRMCPLLGTPSIGVKCALRAKSNDHDGTEVFEHKRRSPSAEADEVKSGGCRTSLIYWRLRSRQISGPGFFLYLFTIASALI